MIAASLSLAVPVAAHNLDRAPPTFAPPGSPPLSTQVNAGGANVDWGLVGTVPTGNPHSDIDFVSGGRDLPLLGRARRRAQWRWPDHRKKAYAAGQAHELRLPAAGLARGIYRVSIRAERPGRVSTATLSAVRVRR